MGTEPADKEALRARVLARRDAAGPGQRLAWSRTIFARVAGLGELAAARTVLAYAGFGSEPDTDGFLAAIMAGGKVLVLPRVERGRPELALYRVADPVADLAPGSWGIREPIPERCAAVGIEAVDFVLVPGVAFDARGGRLGYGRGYYDRLLARLAGRVGGAGAERPSLVAAAFELQLVPEVPMGPHDRRVDRVVTERGCYP